MADLELVVCGGSLLAAGVAALLYFAAIRKAMAQGYLLLMLVLALSALSESAQLLALLWPRYCRLTIILSNTFDFLTGLWTTLIAYLVLKLLQNQAAALRWSKCLRTLYSAAAALGVATAVLMGVYIQLSDDQDRLCWFRPDSSHSFTYAATFSLPDCLAATANLALLAGILMAKRRRGHITGVDMAWAAVVQVSFSLFNLVARTLVLTVGLQEAQRDLFCISLLQPVFYSLVILVTPQAQQAIRDWVNGTEERDSLKIDSFLKNVLND